MSEEKAKTPAKAATPGAAVANYTPKKVKNAWTLERCKKLARRYTNMQEWETGSPSSFKAANAHGWVNECKSLFKKSDGHKKIKKSA